MASHHVFSGEPGEKKKGGRKERRDVGREVM